MSNKQNILQQVFLPREEIVEGKDREEVLKNEIRRLRRKLRTRKTISRLFIIFGIFLIIFTPIAYFFLDKLVAITSLVYALILLMSGIVFTTRYIEIEIRDVENELDLLSTQATQIEKRAEQLFKLHQFELKKYYDQNLDQSRRIFWVGIASIFLGFAIIGATIYIIAVSPLAQQLSEKIVSASLGAVGTILSNFVGAIFLKMYSETIKSSTEFHNRLVITHHLHFGNFLASKIEEKATREKTLADMAINLAKLEIK